MSADRLEEYGNVVHLPVTRPGDEIDQGGQGGQAIEPTRVWTPRRTIDLVVRTVGQVRRSPRHRGLLRRAVRVTGTTVKYGGLGVAKVAGCYWGWVTAAEHAAKAGTDELEGIRKRRRVTTVWLAGGGAFVDSLLAHAAGLPLWAPAAALAAAAAGIGGVAEYAGRVNGPGDDTGGAGHAIGTYPRGSAVRRALASVKGLGKYDDIRVVGPIARDRDVAWVANVQLPPGITATKLKSLREEVASAFDVKIACLAIDAIGDGAGRARIWCADSDPLAGKPIKSPLIGRETPFDVWTERVYMGLSPRGEVVSFSPVGKAMLTGGEPGSGKSVADDQVLCAASLDPYVSLWLADAKRVELAAYKPVAERYLSKPDPEEYLAMVEELVAEMDRRYEVMEAAGVVKVTGKNWRRLNAPFLVFHTDEVQFFTTSKLGGQNGPITVGLADLVGRGRAAGLFTSIATQRPAAEVVPTRLRDIMTTKLAMMCFTNAASDTILGQGMASKGYSGAHFDKDHKGAGWLHAEGSEPVQVRTGYLNKPDEGEAGSHDVRDIVEVAYRLRRAAGTLPVTDTHPGRLLLGACITACGGAEKIWTADLLERLARDAEWEHLAGDPGELARLLKPYGVAPKGQDIDGTNRNGYRRSQFEEALNRLLRR